MFNLQERKLAVVENWLQLVIHFTLKAFAVDIITPQENFIMLAKSNLKWHSNNSSCKCQVNHFFPSGCKIGDCTSLVMFREVCCEEVSRDLTEILGQKSLDLKLKGWLSASVFLFPFSSFLSLYQTSPSAVMSFCSVSGYFNLDFMSIYVCFCTFLQGMTVLSSDS